MKLFNKYKLKKWLSYRFCKRNKQKELELLEKQLKMLRYAKTITINEHNFEAAAWYRDKEKILLKKINSLKK